MSFHDFCDSVKTLGLRHGGSVTSWGRSQKRNSTVGGVVLSYHLLWLAVDMVFDSEAGEDAFMLDAKKFGLKVLDEGDHLHVQPLSP